MIKGQYNELIYSDLKRRLGEDACNAAWDYLVGEGHVAAVETGEQKIGWLVEKAMRFLQFAGKSGLLKERSVSMLDPRKTISERLHAASVLWAEQASREDAVAEFRRDILKGKLLDWDDLEKWLTARTKSDDAPAGSKTRAAKESQTQALCYAIPSDRWERVLPITPNGVLDRLRAIVQQLTNHYRWQEAQATVFVLTGRVPSVPAAQAEIEREAVVLTVDPSLTPRQVADYYRRFRREFLGGNRIRALSVKHLQLAAFEIKNHEWAKAMDAWNRSASKDDRYDNVGRFKRDCLQARKRVLNPLPPLEVRLLRHIEKQKRDEQEQAARSTRSEEHTSELQSSVQ